MPITLNATSKRGCMFMVYHCFELYAYVLCTFCFYKGGTAKRNMYSIWNSFDEIHKLITWLILHAYNNFLAMWREHGFHSYLSLQDELPIKFNEKKRRKRVWSSRALFYLGIRDPLAKYSHKGKIFHPCLT